jgi:UDP-N-acetylglucosamine 2-epimerase (non-hydrolysing)
VQNLLREGRPKECIYFVGNVMIDALQHFLPHARRYVPAAPYPLADQQLTRFGLVTLHRPSTVDDIPTLRSIWGALAEIAEEIPLIFPVHPRTHAHMAGAGLAPPLNGSGKGLRLVSPLSYLHFLKLLSEAALVITDSGGVQEETTALRVPCLTVRENTERPVTLSEGTNVLVGLDPNRLLDEARKVLRGEARQGRVPELWDGHAAERIVNILIQQVRVPEREPARQPRFRSVGEIV